MGLQGDVDANLIRATTLLDELRFLQVIGQWFFNCSTHFGVQTRRNAH